MIHLSKMGDNLSLEDKVIQSKYYIRGRLFRLGKDIDGYETCSLYFDLKDLEHVCFELNCEVESNYIDELESMKDSKPEDIKF